MALYVPVGVLVGFADADWSIYECAALERLLADARQGRSAVLVLRGEPGIGKSALLHHVTDQAEGFTTVYARGEWSPRPSWPLPGWPT
jgi:predicted ATP-dependent serine protease